MLVWRRGHDLNSAAIIEALRELLEVLPEDMSAADLSGISSRRRKQLIESIRETIQRLDSVAVGLDPIQVPRFVFDPSNPEVVGKLIGDTLLDQPCSPLGSIPRFYGSGVYAIYYTGDFPAYSPIKGSNTPIYVGKADPAILDARTPIEQGERLFARLNGDHARNIRKAEEYGRESKATNFIKLEDFECRHLVVRSAWQRTAEDYLIGRFKPVWNDEVGLCYGFGKHGDSPKTRSNTRSPWDTLHPGRPWATHEDNVPNPLTADEIVSRILEHYKQNPPLTIPIDQGFP